MLYARSVGHIKVSPFKDVLAMEFLPSVHPEKNSHVFTSIKFTLGRPKFTRQQQENCFVLR